MLIITVETSATGHLLASSCLSKVFDRPRQQRSLDLRGAATAAIVDELHATSETDSRSAVLHVEGSLRTPIDMVLRSRVEALLHGGVRRVLLELSGVSDIDAAGVGELVRIFNIAAAAGGGVEIAGAIPHVHRVLDVAGVLPLLTAAART